MYIFLINIGEVEMFESISPIFNANMLFILFFWGTDSVFHSQERSKDNKCYMVRTNQTNYLMQISEPAKK